MRRHRSGRHLTAILAGILSALGASAGQAPAPDTDAGFRTVGLPDNARGAWEATVLLETRTWTGGAGIPSLATGSGLVLAHDPESRAIWIATSSHVVACPGRCLVRTFLPKADGLRGRVSATAEVAWRDPRRDLALLRATLPRQAAVRVAPNTAEPPAAGSGILAIGFPDLWLLRGESRSGRSATPQKRFSTGRLIGSPDRLDADYFSYGSTVSEGRLDLSHALTHSAALLPGSSGGPLIDASGRVLGINTGSLTTSGADSCAARRSECRVHLAVPLSKLLEKTNELKAQLNR